MFNDTVSMLGEGSLQTILHTLPNCYDIYFWSFKAQWKQYAPAYLILTLLFAQRLCMGSLLFSEEMVNISLSISDLLVFLTER